MIEQHGLGPHHVAHRDHRKIETPGLTGARIDRGRAGAAHAGTQHVGADNEIPLGVDRPARPHHGFPPAGLSGHRVNVGDMLVAGEGVAYQNGVAARAVERPVSLVGDLERGKLDARIEPERLVGAEFHDRRTRLVGFARAIRCIERRARFSACFGHLLTPRRHGGNAADGATRNGRQP
jgi:hypothetical protein